MSTLQMATMIGKTITLYDRRTGHCYQATITDSKENWGKLRLQVEQDSLDDVWFEPDSKELASIR